MRPQKGSKINHLITSWPNSAIFTCAYLRSQGFGLDLIKRYRNSGWLTSIGRGAVARTGDSLNWTSGLYALQTQMKLEIHVGAKSALELHGISHFVSPGSRHPLYLMGTPGTKLPSWFRAHDWERRIVFTASVLFPKNFDLGLTQKDEGAYSILISSRERAMFEILSLIPEIQQYEEAKLLMEGLRTLRPKIVQSLLEHCQSFKAKRLFMHLAESTQQPWAKKVELSKVDFGSGKRKIGEGGVFDSKYKISVPKVHEGGNREARGRS